MKTVIANNFYVMKDGIEYVASCNISITKGTVLTHGYYLKCPYTGEIQGEFDFKKRDEYSLMYKN